MRELRSEQEIMSDWRQRNLTEPLVSICSITYNHEFFIEDALEGFLIQKTDFPFEIIIHDDASTDRTADIIREYEASYPNLIKPIYQTENQYSTGNKRGGPLTREMAKGKYIAICEGDDYWTVSYKLQKQVDFLEKHDGYSFVSHRLKRKIGSQILSDDLEEFFRGQKGKLITYENLFGKKFPQLSTFVAKKESIKRIARKKNKYSHFVDIHMFFELISINPGFQMNFFGSVYRIHSGGVWSGLSAEEKYIKDFFTHRNIYKANKNNKVFKNEYIRKMKVIRDYYFINNFSFHKKYLWLIYYVLKSRDFENFFNFIKKDTRAYIKSFLITLKILS